MQAGESVQSESHVHAPLSPSPLTRFVFSPAPTTSTTATATTAAASKKGRTAPYPHHLRRASAPSISLLSGLATQPMSPARPAMRSFQSLPQNTGISSPPAHQHYTGSNLNPHGSSLPSSLPLSLISIKQEPSSPRMLSADSGLGGSYGSSLPSMSTLSHQLSLEDDSAITNQYTEHWHVISKESARRINDLSLLMSMDQSYIVTFQPNSYYIVHNAEVGQHNWFRAQTCTCLSYKYGFDKVRRPATIRVSASLTIPFIYNRLTAGPATYF